MKKGYSVETIKKVIKQLKTLIAVYMAMAVSDIKLSISCGNRKIGRVYNVSTAPIVTCGNCKECKHWCYDIKACLQYGNVRKARARNTALLLKDRNEFFSRIEKFLASKKRCKNKYFRWHVSGEIIDIDYLDHMIRIARLFPDWTFWTYTKMYSVVNAWIAQNGKENLPDNLKIMFSEWNGLRMNNPYNMPVFRVRMKKTDPAPAPFKCPGNCDVCKQACRGCIAGETVYADLH